ncbi:hypothetical protein GQX73_g10616 [Xylaria multiplex]|uniref:Uncharacterized protein n=1 Tax=Xylaria multiplex TaxID=323545 RepID=A0A7C8ISL6_9PEZI|nr:hypothetical protein GQX73_g10616 [Xylaria multiplex]
MATAPSDLPKDEAKVVPPIPVPTYGAGGVFAVACSTEIRAPALTCLEKVLDLSSYSTWNTFVPSALLTAPGHVDESLPAELKALASRPGYVSRGAKVRFNAVMTPGGASRAVDLEATFLEAFDVHGRSAYRVVWKAAGIPYFLLHSERVQEFVERVAEDGSVSTSYSCWETFGGCLGYVLPRAQIEGGFARWMDGLKKAAEAG